MSPKDIKLMTKSLIVLLEHVIKIVLHNEFNSSWTGSIYSELVNVKRYNTRTGGSKVNEDDDAWLSLLKELLPQGAFKASREALNGKYRGIHEDLMADLDTDAVYTICVQLLLDNESVVAREKIVNLLKEHGYK